MAKLPEATTRRRAERPASSPSTAARVALRQLLELLVKGAGTRNCSVGRPIRQMRPYRRDQAFTDFRRASRHCEDVLNSPGRPRTFGF